MRLNKLHSWDVSINGARIIQEKLREKVRCENAPGLSKHPRLLAGVDVACRRYRLPEPQREAHRRVTLLSRETEILERFAADAISPAPVAGSERWN